MFYRLFDRCPVSAAILLVLLTSSCVNVTTTPMLEDQTVKPQFSGEDCAYVAFGFYLGNAKADVARTANYRIDRVRRIDIEDFGFLGFGYHCVVVTGEGAPVPAETAPAKKGLTPDEYYKRLEERAQ